MKKSAVIDVLNDLPKEFDLDDLIERLIVIEKIDQGLKDVKRGKTISHIEVKKQIKKWRK